jgi:hypothetical protein
MSSYLRPTFERYLEKAANSLVENCSKWSPKAEMM